MVAFHLHLGQLETSERVDFNHALGDAVVDKAAHRLAKIALGNRRFLRQHDLQSGGMHQPNALVAVLDAEGF